MNPSKNRASNTAFEDSAPPHALITGGAGFIGSHLAEALLTRGHRVTVIDDLSTGRFENIQPFVGHPRFRFAIDRITNEVVMDRLMSECDIAYHLAAAVGVALIVQDPVRVLETNIVGTHAVLKIANRYRKKILIASTSEIYGKSQATVFREDADRLLGPTTRPRWSYSTSKAVDEFLALAYHRQLGLPTVIFRLFNTIGVRQTGQYGMVVPRFVRQALGGEPLTVYGDGQQSRCFLDVRDAVAAIIALAECEEAVGQVFNIGSTEEIAIHQLAQRILALTDEARSVERSSRGAENRIVLVPYEEAYGADFEDMHRRVPDTARIRATVGWTPKVPLDETLRAIIQSL